MRQRRLAFEREAHAAAALNHPYIAAIYELEEANEVSAIAMELVEGSTLSERIAKGPIPVAKAIELAKHIAEALEYAHDKGASIVARRPATLWWAVKVT